MQRYFYNVIKLLLLFISCIVIFYFALRAMHYEYDYYHRYDEPEGAAVKVFLEDHHILNYFDYLFRLGE